MPKKVFIIWKEEHIIGALDDSIFKNTSDIINAIPNNIYETYDIDVEELSINPTLDDLFKKYSFN